VKANAVFNVFHAMGTQLNSLKISQLKALALSFNSQVK
jgi:hypothetical protein